MAPSKNIPIGPTPFLRSDLSDQPGTSAGILELNASAASEYRVPLGEIPRLRSIVLDQLGLQTASGATLSTLAIEDVASRFGEKPGRARALAFLSAAKAHVSTAMDGEGSAAAIHRETSLPLGTYRKLGLDPEVLALLEEIDDMGDAAAGTAGRGYVTLDRIRTFESTLTPKAREARRRGLDGLWRLLELPKSQATVPALDDPLGSPVLAARLESPSLEHRWQQEIAIDNLDTDLSPLAEKAAWLCGPSRDATPTTVSPAQVEQLIADRSRTSAKERHTLRRAVLPAVCDLLEAPSELKAAVTLAPPGLRDEVELWSDLDGRFALRAQNDLSYEVVDRENRKELIARVDRTLFVDLPPGASCALVPVGDENRSPTIQTESGPLALTVGGRYELTVFRRGRPVSSTWIDLPTPGAHFQDLSAYAGYELSHPDGPADVFFTGASVLRPGRHEVVLDEAHRLWVDAFPSGLVRGTVVGEDGRREVFPILGGGASSRTVYSQLLGANLGFGLLEGAVRYRGGFLAIDEDAGTTLADERIRDPLTVRSAFRVLGLDPAAFPAGRWPQPEHRDTTGGRVFTLWSEQAREREARITGYWDQGVFHVEASTATRGSMKFELEVSADEDLSDRSLDHLIDEGRLALVGPPETVDRAGEQADSSAAQLERLRALGIDPARCFVRPAEDQGGERKGVAFTPESEAMVVGAIDRILSLTGTRATSWIGRGQAWNIEVMAPVDGRATQVLYLHVPVQAVSGPRAAVTGDVSLEALGRLGLLSLRGSLLEPTAPGGPGPGDQSP